MATFTSFAAYASEVRKLSREFDANELRPITQAMGVKAQSIADQVAAGDLGGDRKFSHWTPPLATQLKDGKDGSTILTPTKDSAGPWTVATSGRNQGNAGGFAGPGVNRKTGRTARTKGGGVRKVRATGMKRWNGTTRGMLTAEKAVKRMQTEVPKVAEDAARKVVMRHFDVS